MTRIAIVEDEAAVREQLAGYVQRYTRQYGTPFEVTEFADGMEILEDYRPQFDIIFLDVEMKHLDGMETARRIRERDGGVLIVFITNMAQYAIRGYAVGALDYVLKPVPYFAFSQQLQKALGQLEKRERHYLAVAVDGGMRRLDAAEIVRPARRQTFSTVSSGSPVPDPTLRTGLVRQASASFLSFRLAAVGMPRRTGEPPLHIPLRMPIFASSNLEL